MSTPRTLPLLQFIRRINPTKQAEGRYTLFLGAGCSVSSGIPSAAALVTEHWLPRLHQIEAPEEADLIAWAKKSIAGYLPTDPAASYGKVFDKLFITPEERQREIEKLCEGRSPAFGYAILAQLVAQRTDHFNMVLTTNFDDLIADALYLYSDARPLVIHHEPLASFIRPTRTRPLVVKLHGDLRLTPKNTDIETASLEEKIEKQAAAILRDRGIIIMGYGGHDASIHKLLRELPPEALPCGAFWLSRNEPRGHSRDWLLERNGFWVPCGSFDEFMLLLQNEFDLPHPLPDRFNRIFTEYHEKRKELEVVINSQPTTPGKPELQQALSATEARLPGDWKIYQQAHRLEKTDPDKAAMLYEQGIQQFPNSGALLGSYAVFLTDIRKDYDAAESLYKRAIATDPNNGVFLGSYALFLSDIRKEYNSAETLYKRVMEIGTYTPNILGKYAHFLTDIRKSHDVAEALFKRSIQIFPGHVGLHGNYANFLSEVRKDPEAAKSHYKQGIEADPNNAIILGNYASFLYNLKDYDAAETFYMRAIELEPDGANNLGNYANLLYVVRKEHNAAEVLYKRAIAADSNLANHLCNYATFLKSHRKDYDAAEANYRRAIELDPNNATSLGNYANLLKDQRKDYAQAETVFERAIKADPNHMENGVNYAGFLLGLSKANGPEQLYRAVGLVAGSSTDAELECAFYAFANGFEKDRLYAIVTAKRLIASNTRSPSWDFSLNIQRAIKDRHPEAQWLPKLAAVISDEASPATLNDWPRWRKVKT